MDRDFVQGVLGQEGTDFLNGIVPPTNRASRMAEESEFEADDEDEGEGEGWRK